MLRWRNIIAVLYLVSWYGPTPSQAQYLTGTARAQFVRGFAEDCIRRYGEDGTGNVPRPIFEQFCRCHAEGIANRLTAEQIKANDATRKDGVMAEGRRCYEEMKEEMRRQSRTPR